MNTVGDPAYKRERRVFACNLKNLVLMLLAWTKSEVSVFEQM